MRLVEASTDYIETPITETFDDQPVRNPMYFHVDSRKLLGDGVLEADEATRLRGLFNALRDACPEYQHLELETFRRTEEALRQIGSQKVIVGGHDVHKHTILPYADANDAVFAGLMEENEPLAQLLDQVRREYTDVHISRDIRDRLIAGLYAERIKHAYKLAVVEAKLQHRNAA